MILQPQGTLYALITTWQNVAAEVGYDLGTLLECPISITNDDLENGNWGNLKKLTWKPQRCQIHQSLLIRLCIWLVVVDTFRRWVWLLGRRAKSSLPFLLRCCFALGSFSRLICLLTNFLRCVDQNIQFDAAWATFELTKFSSKGQFDLSLASMICSGSGAETIVFSMPVFRWIAICAKSPSIMLGGSPPIMSWMC